MNAILEWLAPLAHNMIRWQSERSFEQQRVVSRSNVLLVQTLYFANQEKTEAAITELLVGLNYVWTYSRELNAKALQECASSRVFDECLDLEGLQKQDLEFNLSYLYSIGWHIRKSIAANCIQ
ncbi:hypothetical protein WN943_016022 [Citrus x changshan-huyou]